jgi:ECF sigma factor
MSSNHADSDMTELVRQLLRDHETEALGEIFDRYYPRMLALAARRLERMQVPESVYEPDDALGSSLDTILRLVMTGRVESIQGVDGFWRLFRKVLARKVSAASDRHMSLKRGGPGIRRGKRDGAPVNDSNDATTSHPAVAVPADDFDLFKSNLPRAEVTAICNDVTEQLIGLLQPDLQSVVRMRLEKRTIAYIAANLGVSPRSVDRMVETIRRIWEASGLVEGIEPRKDPPDRKSRTSRQHG